MRKPAIVRGWWATFLIVSLASVAAVAYGQTRARPWLGVYMQDLTSDLREGMDYKGQGVLITRVAPDSPAERAGMRKGDIVVSLNSRSVQSPDELSRQIRDARVGQDVKITVVRDGSRRVLTARLAERSEADEDYGMAPEAPEGPAPPELPEAPRAFRFDRDGSSMPMMMMMGRGRLGVRVDDLNQDLGTYFSVPDGKGALVTQVIEDTPAARAGMKAGDVILRVGTKSVKDTEELTRAIRAADEGKTSLTVMRKGAKRTFDVELGRAPRAMWRDLNLGPMGFGDDGDHMTIHRHSVDRSDSDELRQLRDEVRMLRERLEKLEQHD